MKTIIITGPTANEKAHLSQVAEEIVKIKFKDADTVSSIKKKFYRIMKKHDVKWGIREENGINGPNPEWMMCRHTFLHTLQRYLELKMVMYDLRNAEKLSK